MNKIIIKTAEEAANETNLEDNKICPNCNCEGYLYQESKCFWYFRCPADGVEWKIEKPELEILCKAFNFANK